MNSEQGGRGIIALWIGLPVVVALALAGISLGSIWILGGSLLLIPLFVIWALLEPRQKNHGGSGDLPVTPDRSEQAGGSEQP